MERGKRGWSHEPDLEFFHPRRKQPNRLVRDLPEAVEIPERDVEDFEFDSASSDTPTQVPGIFKRQGEKGFGVHPGQHDEVDDFQPRHLPVQCLGTLLPEMLLRHHHR